MRTSVPINLDIPLTVGDVSNEMTIELRRQRREHPDDAHQRGPLADHPVASQVARIGLERRGDFRRAGRGRRLERLLPLARRPRAVLDALDNQPISDQSSKAFSTQPPLNAIQSLEVITGATPAEYGDKTSLVINAITRSGLGQKKPAGSMLTRYGSFGGAAAEATLVTAGRRSVISPPSTSSAPAASSTPPNSRRCTQANRRASSTASTTARRPKTLHLNLLLARNFFQIPNTYEQQALGQDQRQLVRSLNVAPGYVRVFGPSTTLAVNPYYRLDQVWYFPSADPLSDQTTTLSQQRRLTNAGLRADVAYAKGSTTPNSARKSHTLF